jgi:hypothetical protein
MTPRETILTSGGISLFEMKNKLRIDGSAICRRKYREAELATATTGVSGFPAF